MYDAKHLIFTAETWFLMVVKIDNLAFSEELMSMLALIMRDVNS